MTCFNLSSPTELQATTGTVHKCLVRTTAALCLLSAALFGMSSLRADDAAWTIYVMQADGGGVRKVARIEDYRAHGSPRWSHDGKRLAFDASGGPNGARKFFVVNLDGSGLQELGEHAMPDWSLDDKQIVYSHYGAAGAQAGTWVQNVDGKGATWMFDGVAARWSPDGSQLVFMDMPEKLVMTLDVVQGDRRLLYDGNYERIEPGFDWSPDGKRLAVIGVNNSLQQRDLVIVAGDRSGSKVRLSERGLEGPIAWSPDGKQLAVAIEHRICVLEVDGAGAPKEIAGQVARSSDPAWSPDGKWLAFASDRE
jgi:Tol biopolymer transport system component